ncbi:hypothetical protein Leryth_002402 [Lithospermum erythrorhizon]|nr:hypothetical protein Leryth_002402 [Lithospermum erythrorhizon]
MPFLTINEGVAKAFKSEAESHLKDLLLPFRCFCTRKNMQVNEVILEDSDIVKALCTYVKDNAVENLVLGATTKVGLARKFMSADISGNVSKGAPEFCNVYVINKGKIATVRTATCHPPSGPPRQQIHQSNSAPALRDQQFFPASGPKDRSNVSSKSHAEDMNLIKSPFTRNPGMNNNLDDLSFSNCDISFVQHHGRTKEPNMNSQMSNSSEPEKRMMFGSIFSSGKLPPETNNSLGALSSSGKQSSNASHSLGTRSPETMSSDASFGVFSSNSHSNESNNSGSSPQKMDELEAEMRRLKNKLRQTMEMYSTACKEAITAKQKASEIEQWKTDEQQRVGKARLAEETALAIAEGERAKCKAAIEAAEAAQKIAELESQKRKNAEMKADKEAEEKKKMLNAMTNNDVRYRKYTIQEIEAATENFSAARKIGEGGYGPVYKGHLDHTPVAIKVLRPDAAQGESQFKQEVEVLCSIRHPNMVLLLGACPDYGCLVYEYMANGSLEDCIFNRGNQPVIPWQIRFRIAAEIATGLHFLHQTKPEPLVHRDLKPGNILLDRNYVSKISDVGLARLVPPSIADSVTQYHMTSAAGTFCYIDPEYQQTGMLGTKSDIYSLGVMLLQIITARPPMALTHHVDKAIQRGTFAEMLDPAVQDWPVEETMNYAKLALKCTELRKKDRPELGHEILPELNRLRLLAEQSMMNIT